MSEDKFLVLINDLWYPVGSEGEAWEEIDEHFECNQGEGPGPTSMQFADKGPDEIKHPYGVRVGDVEIELDETLGIIFSETQPIDEHQFHIEYMQFLRDSMAKHHQDRFTVKNERTVTRAFPGGAKG